MSAGNPSLEARAAAVAAKVDPATLELRGRPPLPVRFKDEQHLLRIINKIVAAVAEMPAESLVDAFGLNAQSNSSETKVSPL